MQSSIRCPGFGEFKYLCRNLKRAEHKLKDMPAVVPPESQDLCGRCWCMRHRHKQKMWQFGTEVPKA